MHLIEMMGRWAELSFKQDTSTEGYLKEILEGKEASEVPQFGFTYGEIIFDMDDVKRWNSATDRECTILTMADGERIVVKYTFRDFTDLYSQVTGKLIHSVLAPNEEDGLDDL
jgi:hypothetical protein